MQTLIYDELKKRCVMEGIVKSDVFTALKIARQLHLSRNSVSQHLNEMVKQETVIKINTRPVYFYSKTAVEQAFSQKIDICVFDSFASFFAKKVKKTNNFEKLIGSKDSLCNVVAQAKAAIGYPENGLPILLHGATGTGKSMIASLLYEFAQDQKIIEKNKPFIAVNCSEYANNPELLTSNLFGHVRGAFTDAKEDSVGLISVANGGVLFLDEVHCLPAECQEKLFFFMDKGMYHQLGDNEHWLTSNCRLVFATTENPQEVLLKTLLRRIPIIVDIPSLDERPLIEKKNLLYSIFETESIKLQKDIEMSNLVYQILMDFTFNGNIGGMKNAIKATCASAFLNKQKNNAKLSILVHNLPNYILMTLSGMQLKGIDNRNHIMIPLVKLKGVSACHNMLIQLYSQIVTRYEKYEQKKENYLDIISDFKNIIQNYKDYLLYKNRYQKNANKNYLLKILDKIYSIVINKYSLTISNNDINTYANMIVGYTKHVLDAKMWVSANKKQVQQLENQLQNFAPREYNITKEIVDNIKLNLDVELDSMMHCVLTLSLISLDEQHLSSTIALILCHGYSTASSVAEACNHMIGAYIFDGIDMELTISTDKIVKKLDEYLKIKAGFKELILLVDMGSLEEIHKKMKPITKSNIAIINNVTTKLALEVGHKIHQGEPILPVLKEIEDNFKVSAQYVKGSLKEKVILTICATGFGAAKKVSELLYESIPSKVPISIIPYSYQSLLENGEKDSIFLKYDVVLIVGTLDPQVGKYSYISVENLVMNEGTEALDKLAKEHLDTHELKVFKESVMRNFTLSNLVNHLTILNAEKLIDDVEEVVSMIEKDLHIEVNMLTKAGLYIHLSCLIERLLLKNEVASYHNLEDELHKHTEFARIAKKALSVVESRYSVEVPDAEIMLVHNYFKNGLK
ncbi:MAG: sigma 54-interacting transcriptional regulator [Breznakia sp.]